METRILKGEGIRDRIFLEVKTEIQSLHEQFDKVPEIAFIGFMGIPLGKYNMPLHVGSAQHLGFNVYPVMLSENVTDWDLSHQIIQFNKKEEVNAIVLLQPLPSHLNPLLMAGKIDQQKEVEGFHPLNLAGTLMPDTGINHYPMCLPAALVEIFKENNIIPQRDQEWVFLLDDEFMTNPLTISIIRAAASKAVPAYCPVSFINKESGKAVEYCKRADFLVVVSKFTEYVKPEWLKPGVCIIDIYSNLVREVPSKTDPEKLVPVIRGGVNVESVMGVAGSVIPVPGGLMTSVLGILFRNTVLAFKAIQSIQ